MRTPCVKSHSKFCGIAHIHSTISDGGKTFKELAQMYANAGYDFLFRTDHWACSDVGADEGDYPLLWLDGVELDGRDDGDSLYHVVCLGTFTDITRDMGFLAALEAARAQGGFLILAHPHWTGNSLKEALRWNFHGVEVYNHVCRWLNGKGDGSVHWDAMLRCFPDTFAFAVDDAHMCQPGLCPEHPGWNGGWIMVNASGCSREALQDAIRAGNFYSTCGPEFETIEYFGNCVSVRTSPVRFVRLVGPAYLGRRIGSFDGELLDRATMEVPSDWRYVYLEVEDDQGRRAWTNTLFVAGA